MLYYPDVRELVLVYAMNQLDNSLSRGYIKESSSCHNYKVFFIVYKSCENVSKIICNQCV